MCIGAESVWCVECVYVYRCGERVVLEWHKQCGAFQGTAVNCCLCPAYKTACDWTFKAHMINKHGVKARVIGLITS